LHFASLNGQLEIVKFLLNRGADIHARDIDGRTPSGLASRKGERHIVQFLSGVSAKLTSQCDFPPGETNRIEIDEGNRSVAEPEIDVGGCAAVIDHAQWFDCSMVMARAVFFCLIFFFFPFLIQSLLS